MEIITRKKAKYLGLTRYYPGTSCVHGHVSERFTSSGFCTACYEARKEKKKISGSALMELFNYNPDTGELFFKSKPVLSILSGKSSRTDYYRVNVGGKSHLAHRIIWQLYYGSESDGQIDHIDGNGLNNKISNLRSVTPNENMRNCRLSKNNTTGVNGVWVQGKKYIAEIMVNRRKISLGSFDDLKGAKRARKAAEVKYGFYARHGEDK